MRQLQRAPLQAEVSVPHHERVGHLPGGNPQRGIGIGGKRDTARVARYPEIVVAKPAERIPRIARDVSDRNDPADVVGNSAVAPDLKFHAALLFPIRRERARNLCVVRRGNAVGQIGLLINEGIERLAVGGQFQPVGGIVRRRRVGFRVARGFGQSFRPARLRSGRRTRSARVTSDQKKRKNQQKQKCSFHHRR